jgi:endonuclease/exonuclease/phosphatase family metal-dependent hydrolase
MAFMAASGLALCAAPIVAAPKTPAAQPKVNPNDVVVASWNIENFFDDYDDPDNPGDDEFTPSGWRRWSTERYRLKLTNCADIISMMKPDVLVLAEVENRRVLDDLCKVLDDVYHYPMPYVMHRDSTDFRGIDVCMVSRIKPERVTWIKPGTGLRDSPMVDFKVGTRQFTVIGNHWKSRVGDKQQSDATRSYMASKVKASWNYLLKQNPAAAVVVTGDFNDDIEDYVPRVAGGFSLDRAEVLRGGTNLFSISSELPVEKRSTYFYSQTKTWHSFDQMNVSRGLLKEGRPASPWYTSSELFEVVATDKQRQKDYFNAPYPFRRIGTKYGQKILSGYSDHFPVLIHLKARQ